MDKDLEDWLDETGAWDEFNEWMEPRDEARTAKQVHSNYMLFMRRMMKEIALIMRFQDQSYIPTSEECGRFLGVASFDEERIERNLHELMNMRVHYK